MTIFNEPAKAAPGLLFAALSLATPAIGQDQEALVRQSSIIFVGRVTDVGSSALATLPASPDMLVVTVERVLDTPASVSLQADQPVTVKMKQAGTLKLGDQAVFYTNGRIFGATLAVEEVGHEPVAAQAATSAEGAMAAAPNQPNVDAIQKVRAAVNDQALEAQIRSAAAVVVGRVREVREPAAAAGPGGGVRITEHDPQIAEAVIDVTDGIKGAQTGSQVVVRFPNSQDVAWFDYPRFHVGETGVFILQPDTLVGGEPARLGAAQAPTFNATKRSDVLPLASENLIRSLAR